MFLCNRHQGESARVDSNGQIYLSFAALPLLRLTNPKFGLKPPTHFALIKSCSNLRFKAWIFLKSFSISDSLADCSSFQSLRFCFGCFQQISQAYGFQYFALIAPFLWTSGNVQVWRSNARVKSTCCSRVVCRNSWYFLCWLICCLHIMSGLQGGVVAHGKPVAICKIASWAAS